MSLQTFHGLFFAVLASAIVLSHVVPAVGASTNGEGQAAVEIFVPLSVIYPGTIISEAHIERKSIRTTGTFAAAIVTSQDALTGLVARRTLVPGQPIAKDALRSPTVVQQGQPVTVHYRDGQISIALSGVAIQSGGVGDMISIRNADTGRTLRAIIRSDRTLDLSSP